MNKQRRPAVDVAWEQLFRRLDADGLLPGVPRGERKFAGRWWYAAALILLLAGAGWGLFRPGRTAIRASADWVVVTNETTDAALATGLSDGSVVFLSREAQLSYREAFSAEEREVTLLGDACFDIVSDRESPFVIETAQARIRVPGTSFTVESLRSDAFRLNVREGTVEVQIKHTGMALWVKAGESVIQSGDKWEVRPTSDGGSGGWLPEGMHFKDWALGDVIGIVNKYGGGRVCLVLSPGLEQRKITATFRTTDPEEIADMIRLVLHLEIFREASGETATIRLHDPKVPA